MEAWEIAGELRAYRTVPAQPRAVVLLLHGFAEHAGRHAATMEYFAQRGIAVYAYDHRGHGRSPGKRALVERFDAAVDTTLAMRRRAAAEHPDLPLLLVGASMGGLMAICSAQRDPLGLAGVVLISPALDAGGSTPRALRAMGKLIAKIAPSVPVASLDLDALSRDPAVATAFRSDPLTYKGKIAARTGAEILNAADAASAAAVRWRLPALILAGAADRITAAAGAQRFAAAAAGPVTLRIIAGGYHEPFNEPGGEQLLAQTADWILARAREPLASAAAGGPETASRRVYTWRDGLAFGAAVNVIARLLGTNTGRYEAIKRPWFAPPGWAFPVVWSINSVLTIAGNLRVLNAPPSADRTAYLRLWVATWLLYVSFGYAFFRRKSQLLGLLVTVNFLVLSILSAARAAHRPSPLGQLLDAAAVARARKRRRWIGRAREPDPLLDPPDTSPS
jgi:acylglycerol lipase